MADGPGGRGPSPGRVRVFLATELNQGASEREAEEHGMRSAWFTRAEVERMITAATLTDAKSIAAYALLLLQHDWRS